MTSAAHSQVFHPFGPQATIAIRLLIAVLKSESREMQEAGYREAMTIIAHMPEGDERSDMLDLYGAARMQTSWHSIIDSSEIGGTQKRFRENVSALLPGARIVTPPAKDHRHQPDAWVEWNGVVSPVEVKRDFFDKAALEQLARYMRVFGCSHGIAVAPALKVAIPQSVTFVTVK